MGAMPQVLGIMGKMEQKKRAEGKLVISEEEKARTPEENMEFYKNDRKNNPGGKMNLTRMSMYSADIVDRKNKLASSNPTQNTLLGNIQNKNKLGM